VVMLEADISRKSVLPRGFDERNAMIRKAVKICAYIDKLFEKMAVRNDEFSRFQEAF
jgi:hypothetical protein